MDLKMHKLVNGKKVPLSQKEINKIKLEWEKADKKQQVTKYIKQRKLKYPSIEDQLDMLWHAMDSGIFPKVPEFYNMIKEIKNKYPKGE